MSEQGYKYISANSIVGNSFDEYSLSTDEYYVLYSFFVTYSMCNHQSMKRRALSDYGWGTAKFSHKNVKDALNDALKLDGNDNFCFLEDKNIKAELEKHNLMDGKLENIDEERAVLAKTNAGNRYLNLFYRIRDGLAHGSFLLRFDSHGNKVVLIQDQDRYNVTARIVLRLETLLRIVQAIDRNALIIKKTTKDEKGAA